MQFTQGLHRAVQQKPEAIAALCNGRQTTFAELHDRVARLAAGLYHHLRVRPGETVAMYGVNSDWYLEHLLAVAWLGAVVNPINFRWNLDEVAHALEESETVALFIDDCFAEHADWLLDECMTVRMPVYCGDGETPEGCIGSEELMSNQEPIPDAQASGDDLFGIFYTGGTTGPPKGVCLSHSNVCTSALSLLGEGCMTDGAVGLHAAPMFHQDDLMLVTSLLLRGGCHVMLPEFRPDRALSLIQEHGITDLLLAPVMLQSLVDAPNFGNYDTCSVRAVYYSASPASEALLERAMAALPHAGFTQVYGMTETSSVMSVLPPADHDADGRAAGLWRSAGRAGLHAQIQIVDENGQPVPSGEAGEIVARGPGVMQGYLKRPTETANALRGGWIHTGDIGRFDEAGYLFIIDRANDMIISGGKNVYSAEVENAVSLHPAVASCAVIGIPCESRGESVHAVIVLKDGTHLDENALIEHCSHLIAGYKCPCSLETVEALPISSTGKVLKNELRAQHWHQGQS